MVIFSVLSNSFVPESSSSPEWKEDPPPHFAAATEGRKSTLVDVLLTHLKVIPEC